MSSARRCLFGRPTPEQRSRTRIWLEDAVKRMRQEESQKWGFDFELETPLPSSAGFVYEVIPENCVPEFYRTKVLTVRTTCSSLDISSTTLTPLSSPSTSDKEEPSLMDPNSSFEDEEEPKKWQFREPPTPRKTPTKRQQKMTDFMAVSRKKNSLSPNKLSPVNVIFTPKSRRPTIRTRSSCSPY
ncbi:Cyclin-dependent kinase inhibitor 1 [Caenorhabditis elegans]|uniref:Cyclin-dependent kinase inhibitor 1 n=1 Tax=Caenorhabditis elegans TaxID=6239 RepID=CKI1_CAEEL|nr:Cyclin-dependent kinase inhibitor 1 [Caenorhabditis elegans]Q22197.1 RecName: Full=Cyclin-dependent kinase inhibitor 1 [Caenorhabditis elegans]AAF13868.1 cyclin-dependent kinase inhibitor [Caenorhabditis elegans]CAA90667.1 Cyclin-dependent kinase inhibitor 1 [Caenorhabditis elegans]|eukprot:NP_495641.1 Cyclin-dependent kinase inhibitor 1 [Caenorhabditis elegans]